MRRSKSPYKVISFIESSEDEEEEVKNEEEEDDVNQSVRVESVALSDWKREEDPSELGTNFLTTEGKQQRS